MKSDAVEGLSVGDSVSEYNTLIANGLLAEIGVVGTRIGVLGVFTGVTTSAFSDGVTLSPADTILLITFGVV